MAELAARDTRIAVRRARVAARLLAANTALKDCKYWNAVNNFITYSSETWVLIQFITARVSPLITFCSTRLRML
jgi:hypothetical protein